MRPIIKNVIVSDTDPSSMDPSSTDQPLVWQSSPIVYSCRDDVVLSSCCCMEGGSLRSLINVLSSYMVVLFMVGLAGHVGCDDNVEMYMPTFKKTSGEVSRTQV